MLYLFTPFFLVLVFFSPLPNPFLTFCISYWHSFSIIRFSFCLILHFSFLQLHTCSFFLSLSHSTIGSQENKHKIHSAGWMYREAFGVGSEETLLWLRRMIAHSIKPWWLLCFQSCRLYRTIHLCAEFKDGVRPWIDITAPSPINYTLCVSVKTCDE